MDRVQRKRGPILVVLTSMLAVMLIAGPALAAPPLIVRDGDMQHSEVGQDCSAFGLPGVTYDVSLTGREVGQIFDEGAMFHVVWQGSAVASNGIQIRIHHSWTEKLDFVANTLTLNGIAFGATVEKSSISRKDRGKLVLDLDTFEPIFMAGKWQPWFGPHAATCELIAAAVA